MLARRTKWRAIARIAIGAKLMLTSPSRLTSTFVSGVTEPLPSPALACGGPALVTRV